MVTINESKCIGCGLCVKDCFTGALTLKEDKASFLGGFCMECGHCIAVCPKDAVCLEGYDMTEVLDMNDLEAEISAKTYLNHLKSRRTIRSFTKEAVTEDEIKMILEAGRFSPTGGNSQTVSYHVIQKGTDDFKKLCMDKLYEIGLMARQSGNSGWFSDFFIKMKEEYASSGKDSLFFDAGTVIMVASNSASSALLAAAHMETMVYSLGLGMLYSGFTVNAVSSSKEISDFIRLKDGYRVYAAMIIGHPAVTYQRTVPRKPLSLYRN